MIDGESKGVDCDEVICAGWVKSDELNHISDWAQNNNLKLNLAKSQEIVFVDKQRKHNFAVPSKLKEIQRWKFLVLL